MAIQTLTGNEFEAGSAIDNTQTDQFTIIGPNNIVLENGGNLIVKGYYSGTYGLDTGTTVMLGTAFAVNDQITLNGSGNALVGNGPLFGSTVNFTVSGLGSGLGMNTVSLDNAFGMTTISLGGINNTVMLNGDAINSVSLGDSGGSVLIGSYDDNLFGFTSTVSLSGDGNTVAGGDEDFTVSGGVNANTVALGDGTNSVSLSGVNNTITVGGGNNTINAGGSGAVVAITGVDGVSAPTFAAGADLADAPVPPSPTDWVIIAGTGDQVVGTYENVDVLGLGVTSNATITLGDGNNIIVLKGTGGNKVSLGNGGNAINATGDASLYMLGSGKNAVTLSGNTNTISVNDPTFLGFETVQLGAGRNDVVKLDHAGGTITGTAFIGVTTVTQTGPNAVNVNLNYGTGNISLGDGNDTVNANGAGSSIVLGNGADVVTANGAGTHVTVGNGNDKVTANGINAVVKAGNGNDSVMANGANAVVTVGNGNDSIWANGNNAHVTAGTGNDTIYANGNFAAVTVGNLSLLNGNVFLSALGSGDHLLVNASPTSVDTVNMGSNDALRITNGRDTISCNGAGDSIFANNLHPGSVINTVANNTAINLGMNSSAYVHLNPVGTGEVITVQALTSAPTYTGTVDISGFGLGDKLDLQGLGFTSFAGVISHMTFGPLHDTLSLGGGGAIMFDKPTAFSASEFVFTSAHGPV